MCIINCKTSKYFILMTYNVHYASSLSSLYLVFLLNLTNSFLHCLSPTKASPSVSCQHERRLQQPRARVSSSRVQPRSSGAGGEKKKKSVFLLLCGRSPTTESGRKQVGQICPVPEQRTFHRQATKQNVNNVTRFSTLDSCGGEEGVSE